MGEVFVLLAVTLLWNFSNAESVVEVLVNQSVIFNCSTNNTSPDNDIRWKHYPPGHRTANVVYGAGRIKAAYQGRFEILRNALAGTYNLNVKTPEIKDAGQYECLDERGTGKQLFIAELIVIGTAPECESDTTKLDSILGQNMCGLEPDQIPLSCSLPYDGNSAPSSSYLEWTRDGSSATVKQCTGLPCKLTVKGDLALNGASFICRLMNSSKAETYSCSVGPVNVIYVTDNDIIVKQKVNEEAECEVNANLKCTYKWFYENELKSWSSEPRVIFIRSGHHRCEAKCQLRNSSCIFTAGHFTVEGAASAKNTGVIVAIVVVVVLVVLGLVIGAGLFLWIRRLKMRKPKGDQLNEKELQLLIRTKKVPSYVKGVISLTADTDYESFCKDKHLLCEDVTTLFGPFWCKEISGNVVIKTYKVRGKEDEQIKKITENITNMIETLTSDNLLKIHDGRMPYRTLYLVQEYVDGGKNLQDVLSDIRRLPRHKVIDWATQIVAGMIELHEKKIIHRCLWPCYVLIRETDQNQIILKITSYIYEAIEGENPTISISAKGLDIFQPPEVLNKKLFSKLSDIYSFGVLLWKMLGGDKMDAGQPYKALQDPSLAPDGAEEFAPILKVCCDEDPSKRIQDFFEIKEMLANLSL